MSDTHRFSFYVSPPTLRDLAAVTVAKLVTEGFLDRSYLPDTIADEVLCLSPHAPPISPRRSSVPKSEDIVPPPVRSFAFP